MQLSKHYIMLRLNCTFAVFAFISIQNRTWPEKPRREIYVFYWVNFKVWNNPWSQSWQTLGSGHLKVSFRTNAKEEASCTSFPNTVLFKVPLNLIKFFLIVWHTILPCSTNGITHQGHKLKPTVSITPTWGPAEGQGWTRACFVGRWCPYPHFQGALVLVKLFACYLPGNAMWVFAFLMSFPGSSLLVKQFAVRN